MDELAPYVDEDEYDDAEDGDTKMTGKNLPMLVTYTTKGPPRSGHYWFVGKERGKNVNALVHVPTGERNAYDKQGVNQYGIRYMRGYWFGPLELLDLEPNGNVTAVDTEELQLRFKRLDEFLAAAPRWPSDWLETLREQVKDIYQLMTDQASERAYYEALLTSARGEAKDARAETARYKAQLAEEPAKELRKVRKLTVELLKIAQQLIPKERVSGMPDELSYECCGALYPGPHEWNCSRDAFFRRVAALQEALGQGV